MDMVPRMKSLHRSWDRRSQRDQMLNTYGESTDGAGVQGSD